MKEHTRTYAHISSWQICVKPTAVSHHWSPEYFFPGRAR